TAALPSAARNSRRPMVTHMPLPCEVRKGNDTTPRACCPKAPGAGGAHAAGQAATGRARPMTSGLISRDLFSAAASLPLGARSLAIVGTGWLMRVAASSSAAVVFSDHANAPV